jgi:hypothetical protein
MTDKEIKLENLTKYQVEMLDIMWSLDSPSEFASWYDLLDKEDQALADCLVRMIVIETVEQEAIIDDNCYKEANAVLSKFRLN